MSSSPLLVFQAKLRRYISSEHLSVDGTLLNAWASHKSLKPEDGPPPSDPPAGSNAEVPWRGEKLSHDRHVSTIDPEARHIARATTPQRCCALRGTS